MDFLFKIYEPSVLTEVMRKKNSKWNSHYDTTERKTKEQDLGIQRLIGAVWKGYVENLEETETSSQTRSSLKVKVEDGFNLKLVPDSSCPTLSEREAKWDVWWGIPVSNGQFPLIFPSKFFVYGPLDRGLVEPFPFIWRKVKGRSRGKERDVKKKRISGLNVTPNRIGKRGWGESSTVLYGLLLRCI